MPDQTPALLIWDGECGFCRNAVSWLLDQDRRARFQAVPFQDLPSPPMTPALRRQAERAVQVLTPQGQQAQSATGVRDIGRATTSQSYTPVQFGCSRLARGSSKREVAARHSAPIRTHARRSPGKTHGTLMMIDAGNS